MQPFGRFNVVDDDGKSFIFKVGDNALILPADCEGVSVLPEENYWVGRIKDIRSRQVDADAEVWAKVQWYFSAEDTKSIIPSL
ncbi:hypothetical protein ONZ45_g12182 [Pleurotus djamor]|nr:hypothetical protein ONZ45_g12182 [Pleurotus djamor]